MPRLTKNKIFYLAILMAAILQLCSAEGSGQKDPPAEAVNEGDEPKKPKSGEAGSSNEDDPQKEDSQQQDGKVKSKDSKTSKISSKFDCMYGIL